MNERLTRFQSLPETVFSGKVSEPAGGAPPPPWLWGELTGSCAAVMSWFRAGGLDCWPRPGAEGGRADRESGAELEGGGARSQMPDQKHTIITGSFSYKHPKLYVARVTVYFCVWFVTSASSTVRYSHVMVCCLSSKAKLVVDLFQKTCFLWLFGCFGRLSKARLRRR